MGPPNLPTRGRYGVCCLVNVSRFLLAPLNGLPIPLTRAAALGFLHAQLLAVDVQVRQGGQGRLHQVTVLELQEGVTIAAVPDDTEGIHLAAAHLCLEGAHPEGAGQAPNKQRRLAAPAWTEPPLWSPPVLLAFSITLTSLSTFAPLTSFTSFSSLAPFPSLPTLASRSPFASWAPLAAFYLPGIPTAISLPLGLALRVGAAPVPPGSTLTGL
ncbi:hypothetical protein DPMN_070749 [Dreissena polymorpha]|uniref:Uncharacterized protein n=1 Tax=Dreissena polymorpha TaxID=45954 RepID=A0A9D3Z3L2_DREPO|nr:hypothetical protein DPMN_070749 [Dreissena polymorpha]